MQAGRECIDHRHGKPSFADVLPTCYRVITRSKTSTSASVPLKKRTQYTMDAEKLGFGFGSLKFVEVPSLHFKNMIFQKSKFSDLNEIHRIERNKETMIKLKGGKNTKSKSFDELHLLACSILMYEYDVYLYRCAKIFAKNNPHCMWTPARLLLVFKRNIFCFERAGSLTHLAHNTQCHIHAQMIATSRRPWVFLLVTLVVVLVWPRCFKDLRWVEYTNGREGSMDG